MPVYTTTQLINSGVDRCWSFFSNPANLAVITPGHMNFRIQFPQPVPEMYEGMIIVYKVSPLLNISVEWITEISKVSKPYYFVDKQLKGPYRVWHHQHFFEEIEGGMKITDIVTYSLPFGYIGRLVAGKYIHSEITKIFEHRRKVIDSIFNQ